MNPALPFATDLSEAEWHTFLQRPPLSSAFDVETLRGQSIFVTGAGGSIGSALSLRLASLAPRRLILLDASEQATYRLQQQLPKHPDTISLLGSVNDAALLNEIFDQYQPDLVFHAAAHKHAPLLEHQPLAAITTNTLGTLTLTECLRRHSHARMILLSTDKAVEPTSILGVTKRVAELITLAAAGIVLRLANVLGSEGSVVETFLHQIGAGGPITITHPEATRYFLTMPETVGLMLTAASTAAGTGLFIPNLEKPHTVQALADFLLQKISTAKSIENIYFGLRPGDKLSESLNAKDEQTCRSNLPGLLQIPVRTAESAKLFQHLSPLIEAVHARDLPGAIALLREIVPTYQPSLQLQQLPEGSTPRVPFQ